MTQINIATTDLGWGVLKLSLEKAKSLRAELRNREGKIEKDRRNLYNLIEELNRERRQRVLNLLKAEKRIICLLHSLVFREIGIEESLISEENVTIIRMTKSWTVTHSCYDGDKTYSHESRLYDTTACRLCRGVVSHGSVTDVYWNEYTEARSQKPEIQTCEELYSAEVIDKISLEYFQMPPVTAENLQSL